MKVLSYNEAKEIVTELDDRKLDRSTYASLKEFCKHPFRIGMNGRQHNEIMMHIKFQFQRRLDNGIGDEVMNKTLIEMAECNLR